MAELPVVLLAFANDQTGDQYLRSIPRELRRLSQTLKGAEAKHLCRLVVLPNATLADVFAAFDEYGDRVAVFHYGGHADSTRLFLESDAAGPNGAPMGMAGFATYLGQREGLQLVFLNACSTRAHSALLLGAGVAAVVATARSIVDSVALELADTFYTHLAAGETLRVAFELARGQVMAQFGESPKGYFQDRSMAVVADDRDGVDSTDDHGFPWEFRVGTELVERWNLPDAAGDPYFGLPPLPERDLPESPFRQLAWYAAEHAEVFFGRGYQIRELYEAIVSETGDPILLYYGPTGVGKSSLLDAGVVPRLQSGGKREVRYRRRDPQLGLCQTLLSVVSPGGGGQNLADAWRRAEEASGKPVDVILDQVEEAYTRTSSAQPEEVDDFVKALAASFGNRETRPKGKLVLGFRKEWLAEIDRRLAEAALPRTRMFLKPLDDKGIMEAVSGPSREGRLASKYKLRVQDGLPERISSDLLADAGSSLAPTLQVVLSKMWERVKGDDPPAFTLALYESLKARGLKDVLDEGLREIGVWKPEVMESGLVLDVLAYHTTELGTAAQLPRADLEARYPHRADVLDGLVSQGKDRYLLIEADPLPGATSRPTRLAHDLLGPLVLQTFRHSVAPGQRSRRLLENRVSDWADGKLGPVLDGLDLGMVEAGRSGMRAWTADEQRLVDASRAEASRREAEEEAERLAFEKERLEKLAALAEGRRLAEERLKDQEAANQKQNAANQKLRRFAYSLGASFVAMSLVALLAAYWSHEAQTEKRAAEISGNEAKKQKNVAEKNLGQFLAEEEKRALAQADELLRARAQDLPQIVEDIRSDPKAIQKVRALGSKPNLTRTMENRVALALLGDDPAARRELLNRVVAREDDPEELIVVRDELCPYPGAELGGFWTSVENPQTGAAPRLRAAAVLAALDPDSSRWQATRDLVVTDLLSVNPLQLGAWSRVFRETRAEFFEPLAKQFRDGKDPERLVAAQLLNDYADDQPDKLIGLLPVADARQFAVIFPRAMTDRTDTVRAMLAELDATPPDARYATLDAAASRKANAFIVLARVGEPADRLWKALALGPDPRLRTYLIERMGPFGVNMSLLLGRLNAGEDGPSVRAALLLALGEFPPGSALPAPTRDMLMAEYATDPDPEFHSAAYWLLARHGKKIELDATDRSPTLRGPAGPRRWLVNSQGQTFAVVRGPQVFRMGSDLELEKEFGRKESETPHRRRIPRSFAIGTREVTVREFARFLRETQAAVIKYQGASDIKQFSAGSDGPVVSVNWYQAAQYCRWLSEKEDVVKDQMCYPELGLIKAGMSLDDRHLKRTGYRLPTEAEWEYACRAGTETTWSFGSDVSLLKTLTQFSDNSTKRTVRKTAECGTYKPNGLGLFDMHGNVNEWVSDGNYVYPAGGTADDVGLHPKGRVEDIDSRIYRGGSFIDLPPMMRSAYRDGAQPLNNFPAVGFRVARTVVDE